jgi:hypothetical protein
MRQIARWVIALAAMLLLALLAACVLLLPKALDPALSSSDLGAVADAERRIELQQTQAGLQHETRAVVLQSLGGLLLVVGAVATWRQVQVSREGQLTERLSHALDQLGNEQCDIRLGGIYTLERIAKNSSADRAPIAEILTAFVRGHAPWPAGLPENPEPHPSQTIDGSLPWLRNRAPDVQAAITILGRRPACRDEGKIDLSLVDLRRSWLTGARLSGAQILQSNLARARMASARLDGADLRFTDLRRAVLENVDLRAADLRRAYLAEANLREAHLERADLRGADLREADLRGAHLEGANLYDAHLYGAQLAGTHTDAATNWPADLAEGHFE